MKIVRFTLIAEGVSAEARLLEAAAPATCAALWDALPVAGAAHHAVYSGSECVLILPEPLRVDPENATSDVCAGDVGFTWFAAGSSHGVDRDFAEVCWFYGADARPSMHEGPAPVSIWARIQGDARAFHAACRRMRREGVKALAIERVEASGPGAIARDVEHIRVHRPRCGACSAPSVLVLGEQVLVAFVQGSDAEGGPDPLGLPLLCRGADGGRAWSAPEPMGGYRYPGTARVRLDALPDGRLLARLDRHRFAPVPRAATGGGAPGREWVARQASPVALLSDDGGWTWRRGPVQASPPDARPDPCGVRAWRVGDEQASLWVAARAGAAHAWREECVRRVGVWRAGEPAVARMPDGRCICVYEGYDGPRDTDPPLGVRGVHATTFRIAGSSQE